MSETDASSASDALQTEGTTVPQEETEGTAPADGELVVTGIQQPSDTPTYTLFYFNLKALAEPLRYLLAYGNLEYDDVRVTRDEWPALKPTMPMGQMPVLEVDGHRVHQSISMARFLARKVGLAGSNDWENLVTDIAVDTVNDFRLKIAVVSYEPDDEVKEKKMITLTTEVIPFYLEKLEAITKDNNGFLALGKLTWADLYLAGILDYLNYLAKIDLLANYPGLKALVDQVNNMDQIKAWLEKRPVTDV